MGAATGSLVGGIAGAVVGTFFGMTAVGWALGSALGGMAGGLIDGPKQNAPRLNDVKIRGADYGQMIPIVWGMIRVGGIGAGQGSVENGPNKFTIRGGDSGGKGGGAPSPESYALSFFNEICEGPIRGVMRRWANGRLITENQEGSSDKWPYALYLGDTTQLPDPTMETIYGTGEVSPMRGRACEMVTELGLDDYGQARPNVEYEVYTTAGDYPWRVSLFDPFPGGGTLGHAATYDSGVITTSQCTAGTPIDYQSSQFQIDGTQVGSTATASVTGWRVYRAIANMNHIVMVYSPSGVDANWWTPNLTTMLTPALSPGIFTPPEQLTGYSPVLMNGRVFSAGGTAGVSTVAYHITPDDDTGTFVDSANLDAVYVPSTINLGTSDTGHLYVCVGQITGTKLWKFDADLNLIKFWDEPETVGTRLDVISGTGGHFFVYNEQICFNYRPSVGAKHIALVTINGDLTLTDHALTLQHTDSPVIYLGDGLGLDEDGVFSLIPPPGVVTLGEIVEAICIREGYDASEIDVTDLTQEVRGFLMGSQMSGENAIMALRQTYFFDGAPMNGQLRFRNRGHSASETIPDEDLCAHVPGSEKPEPLAVTEVPDQELPNRIWLNFYNVTNDYQEGSAHWTRQVTAMQSEVTLNLPVALTAGEAILIAQWHMHFAWLERERFVFFLPDKYIRLRPTDVVVVRGVNVRITDAQEMPSGVIRFEGVRAFAGAFSIDGALDGDVPGDGGSGQPPQDPPSTKADTGLILIDGPLISEADSYTGFRAAVYKDGTGSWTGAGVYKSSDGGTSYTSVASTTSSTIVGTVTDAAARFYGGNVIDTLNVLRVTLTNQTATLSSTNEAGLQNGLNLVAYGTPAAGWEFLQFQTASLVSPGVYDLSGLLRYRFGTGYTTAGVAITHGASEIFVLMAGTIAIPGTLGEIGLARKYKGVTNGTTVADATSQDFTNTGVAGMALSPVLVGGGRNAAGDLTINFTPRRRGTGGWPSGGDLPATDPANWQIDIFTDGTYTTYARAVGVTVTTYDYTAAQQTTDFGSPQATIYLRVAQFASIGGLGFFTRATL